MVTVLRNMVNNELGVLLHTFEGVLAKYCVNQAPYKGVLTIPNADVCIINPYTSCYILYIAML